MDLPMFKVIGGKVSHYPMISKIEPVKKAEYIRANSAEEAAKRYTKIHKNMVMSSELDDDRWVGIHMNESVNEGKYYITRNQGRGRGKSLVGGYDLKKKKNLPPKEFRTFKDAEKEVKRLQNTKNLEEIMLFIDHQQMRLI